uniref:Ribosomal protein L5 n=1 Tax=Schizocladia ischiensis TaxID=196139 RepID=A0A7S6UA40_9STRA|nr:ribosomal protein L5 [Schizocladia ischiensis]QOW07625.1 ribosomal protein L5 [Schizocladia ischiensis]
MYLIEKHYQNLVQDDLILSQGQAYTNPHQIPRMKKVNLLCPNEGGKTGWKDVLPTLGLLDFLGLQKAYLVRSKKSSPHLQISKGEVVASKQSLRGQHMYTFLHKLIFEAMPKLRNFSPLPIPKHPNTYSFQLQEIFAFDELTSLYISLEKISTLHIDFNIQSTTSSEVHYLLQSLQVCIEGKSPKN